MINKSLTMIHLVLSQLGAMLVFIIARALSPEVLLLSKRLVCLGKTHPGLICICHIHRLF